MEAETLINETLDEQESGAAVLRLLNERKEELEASERAKIDSYVQGIRPQIANVMTEELDDGVGGLFDGKITIATETLRIHTSINNTIKQTEEVRRHEQYHMDNNHLAAMTVGDSAEGDIVVTIGGRQMTNKKFIEGLTVLETGDEFVSDDYKEDENDVEAGLADAGLTVADARKAVARKDLRLIDDHSRVMVG